MICAKNEGIYREDFLVKKTFVYDRESGINKQTFMSSDIVLKQDGGFGTSVKNRMREIISVLLYSPFIGRYECINMTYDKEYDQCFVDPGLCRKHLAKYGNPGLPISFDQTYLGSY